MFCCDCFHWSKSPEYHEVAHIPEPFSLPAPLPQWPQGGDFATGRIRLGELEVAKITKFECVWNCQPSRRNAKGVTFYRPLEIPDGFYCLGHYCQPNDRPLWGFVLVARPLQESSHQLPALKKPLNYSLVWSSECGFIWLPDAPTGYRALGLLVTDTPVEPSVDDIRCVRFDLTENSESCEMILDDNLSIWQTRPCRRGLYGRGVCVGTFFGCTYAISEEDVLTTSCLKNQDLALNAMPNLEQVNALIKHYGPTVYFHPDETYMPSSVEWFFENGAVLYENGKSSGGGKRIDSKGSVLPKGGFNDGKFWIDLPEDDEKREYVKRGKLESSELYVHVKPAFGGSFTDIAMWVFCPFNGPATLKVGLASFSLPRVGEHVSDWEHYTLRVSNFTGELWSIYYSEHSGGKWVDASELEYIEGNKAIVYSSKCGHASYAHPGTYLLGPYKLGIGVRNDVAKSKYFVDSSVNYKLVAAEYLGDAVEEPCWLQYMREWGPRLMYDASSEIEKLVNRLPVFVRFSVENLLDLFPTELYGEEGPTGPKEKDNWFGDERW